MIFFTDENNARAELERLLAPHKILRTENGKPYVEGNSVFFSLSHSRGKAVIAVGDKPVGVDLEAVSGRNYPAILKRFKKEELAEISDEVDFLKHWTAREAFIKLRGQTLANCFKRLDFIGGQIYLNGAKQDCKFEISFDGQFVLAVCYGI